MSFNGFIYLFFFFDDMNCVYLNKLFLAILYISTFIEKVGTHHKIQTIK